MVLVSTATDIWQTALDDLDIQIGIDYGIISRAWTYDRMGAQARGDYGKAIFRIAVGKAVQSCFERLLAKRGHVFQRDETDYRMEDYWDIRTPGGQEVDLKGNNIFKNYRVAGRGPLSPETIVRSTGGETWSTFFPMLIPKDQFDTDPKDAYVFYLIESESSSRFPNIPPHPRFLITLPYSKDKDQNQLYALTHRRRYADARVARGMTFSMDIEAPYSRLFPERYNLTIGYGDRMGNAKTYDLSLKQGTSMSLQGLTALHYIRLHDEDRSVLQARATDPILLTRFRNLLEDNILEWPIQPHSFEEVWIHDNDVYFIGWITADEFDRARRRLPAFGPNERYQGNAPHRDERAQGLLSNRSFCYYYPPTFNGGTKNPNYYCLPQDLHTMDSIGELWECR